MQRCTAVVCCCPALPCPVGLGMEDYDLTRGLHQGRCGNDGLKCLVEHSQPGQRVIGVYRELARVSRTDTSSQNAQQSREGSRARKSTYIYR